MPAMVPNVDVEAIACGERAPSPAEARALAREVLRDRRFIATRLANNDAASSGAATAVAVS